MNELIIKLFTLVKEYPGMTGRFYTRLLREDGYPNISKHETNSILYSRKDIFIANIGENYIPAWNVNSNSFVIEEPKTRSTETSKPTKEYESSVTPTESNKFSWDIRFNLFDWQIRALNSWQEQNYIGIIEAVTGSGKTRLAIAAISSHLDLGWKVLIIVSSIDLMNQWKETIKHYLSNYKIGFLGNDYKQSLKYIDILIATSDSAMKYQTLPPNTKGLIIGDEVHQYGTELSKQMLENGYQRRLGLTASLERNDNGVEEVIKKYFKDVVYTYGYQEAIDDNVIAPFKILFLSIPLFEDEENEYQSLTNRLLKLKRKLEQNYPEIMLNNTISFEQKIRKLSSFERDAQVYNNLRFMRSQITVSAESKLNVTKYLKDIISLSNGTFIFTQLSETNQRIGDILVKSGLRIETLNGSDSSKTRNDVLNRFKTKQIHGIAAPMILDQGIDVPSADLAIITGKSKSRRQMIQRIGRVVRRKEDNGMGKIIILISKGTIDDPDTNDNDAFYDVFEDTNIVIKRLEYDGNPKLLKEKIEEWNNG